MRYCYVVERITEKEWTDTPVDRRMSIYGSKKKAMSVYESEKEKIRQGIRGEEEEWNVIMPSSDDDLFKFFIIRNEDGNAADRVSISKIQLQ